MELSYTMLCMASIGYKAFNGVTFITGTFALKFCKEPKDMNKEGIVVIKDVINCECVIGYVDNEECQKMEFYFLPCNFIQALNILQHIINNLQKDKDDQFSLKEAFKEYSVNEVLIEIIDKRNRKEDKKEK